MKTLPRIDLPSFWIFLAYCFVCAGISIWSVKKSNPKSQHLDQYSFGLIALATGWFIIPRSLWQMLCANYGNRWRRKDLLLGIEFRFLKAKLRFFERIVDRLISAGYLRKPTRFTQFFFLKVMMLGSALEWLGARQKFQLEKWERLNGIRRANVQREVAA